jgi:hypothetical protein
MAKKPPFSPAPPQALAPLARTLKYRDCDEHLVRRLGSALVLQWDALPDELQDLIADQAVGVEDRADAPHSRENFETFIRTARAVPLKASTVDARSVTRDEATKAMSAPECSNV